MLLCAGSWTGRFSAAIGKIECDHGRLVEAGCNPPGTVNSAGATGPMQFLGLTWRAGTPALRLPAIGPPTAQVSEGYATDGDGDELADVWNSRRDRRGGSLPARERRQPTRAIFAYNHADWYVDAVLAKADEYRGAFAPARRPQQPGRWNTSARSPMARAQRRTAAARSSTCSPVVGGRELRLLDVHALGVRAGGHRRRS
ncbi:MAG: hypothetical protein R3C15_15745 [Thermoleophilia bacterium]